MGSRIGFAVAVGVALSLFAPAAALAASVTGQVTAEGAPVEGVSVFLGDQEARTGPDGRYAIEAAPAEAQTLVVFKDGFRSETRAVDVPADGGVTADFVLVPDLLYSETLVVTGTRSPTTKRESSVAITTMTDEQIEERQPRSTADLLTAVPGFYVESSGGEVGGNLWARGLPADGSYRYVALMEDGMPVFDSTELSFVNADIFVRVDENLAEVEAVRGGNAALFGSNAPGGVINFLSKTGGNVPETTVKLTTGTDGLYRVGFNNNGPLASDWTYNVGGFYRYDQGVRDPGYPASQGGQLKLNLTRNFDQGYLRTYVKYLDDANVFYLPLPFQAGGDLDFVEGFPFDGTLHTPELNHVRVPRPNGEGFQTLPLDDGQRQEGLSLAGEISWQLPEGWVLNNTARYMEMDHTWNAVVPFDLVGADAFAAGFTGPGDTFQYTLTSTGDPFTPANGLLLTGGLWHVEKPMSSFADQLQLSKTFETGGASHELAVGFYGAHYEVDNLWFFNDVLTDVTDTPRVVDLTVFEAGGGTTRVTENGFRR
ncbi:MAG TPA: TonB-dependent receptor, partial [Thermoanaerobaculia bacterium]|nr:TonB-dependent receptor [Thermoanaerobaculia bacterium]